MQSRCGVSLNPDFGINAGVGLLRQAFNRNQRGVLSNDVLMIRVRSWEMCF